MAEAFGFTPCRADSRSLTRWSLVDHDAGMAKRLGSFEESEDGRGRRYPWAEWTDGNPWEIHGREDYDVETENMRVNLHMKAKQLACKVKTRKFVDADGEGLVFQFLPPKEGMAMNPTTGPADQAALEALYQDCCHMYETARREVTIWRGDGTKQKYAPIRFKQKMDRAYSEGWLPAAAAGTVEQRTGGYRHLEEAGRDDLMLESFLLDESKPYHHLFNAKTLEVAGARLAEYYKRHPRRYGQDAPS
jgi:hypothetical protein